MTGFPKNGRESDGMLKRKKPARGQVFKGFQRTQKRSVECEMVPEAGIEPARPYERGILSPMRLPVSPFGR